MAAALATAPSQGPAAYRRA